MRKEPGMARLVVSSLFIALLFVFVPTPALADEGLDRRVAEIESRVAGLQSQVASIPSSVQSHGSDGGVLFLFGDFCALWAQNTNRNAWLWFFLGLIFSVITVLVLLTKNSEDRKRRRPKSETSFPDVWADRHRHLKSGNQNPVEQAPEDVRFVTSLQKEWPPE
jgi:hypothetical protein